VSQRDDLRSALSLSVRYVKQETLDPAKRLGGMLLWGLVGSVTTAFGVILVALGVLRLLQDETGSTFTGHLDWLPYLITLVVVGAAIALAVSRIGGSASRKRGR
jgi:hypothetical protein